VTSLSTWFAVPNAVSSPSPHSRSFLLRLTQYLMLGLLLLLGVSSAHAQSLVHSFPNFGGDGTKPYYGALAADCSGNLWGTTLWGGANNWGAIYKLPYTSGPIYSFGNVTSDGARPYFGLTLDNHVDPLTGLTLCQSYGTVFYGTTANGGTGCGTDGCGVVFEYDAVANTYTVIKRMATAVDGAFPAGGVAIDSIGNLYGTSQQGYGSTAGCGVVWKLSAPYWTESIVYNFPVSTSGGCTPVSPLTFDHNGNLWGTTQHTGYSAPNVLGYGKVFEFVNTGGTLASSPTFWHTFNALADGAYPIAALVEDSNGNLYGTTYGQINGGWCNAGTVYELSPPVSPSTNWSYNVLYAFPGKKPNGLGGYTGIPGDGGGYYLTGGLAVTVSGSSVNIYGTTSSGNPSTDGTVFRLTNDGLSPNVCSGTTWSPHLEHAFAGGSSDGSVPFSAVILNSSGTTLYGTTELGGAGTGSYGVAYSLSVP